MMATPDEVRASLLANHDHGTYPRRKVCECGHPANKHHGQGTCIAGHEGESSVCPCLKYTPKVKP